MKAEKIIINPVIFLSKKDDDTINKILTKMELPLLRRHIGLTQEDISNITGLSIKCISNIENPLGNPTFNSLAKYLDALDYELTFKEKTIKE